MADVDPRVAVGVAVRELLRVLASLPHPPTLRVADSDGRTACLVQMWPAAQIMPTVGTERQRKTKGARAGCKTDIIEVVTAAGEPLTRKEIARALARAGKSHGPGTVMKALADLTAAGELVNPRDKKGYRLTGWRKRSDTPSLFD